MSKAAIEVENLSFHFDDGTKALAEVSLSIAEGEAVAIVGANGAGKSTLLLHLAGVLPEEGDGHGSGRVFIQGQRLDRESIGAMRRRVGLLFQDPDDQLFCPTVAEDVAFGVAQLGLDEAEVRARVASSLARVGLAGFDERAPHRLSGGEKKRAALAGLLAYSPSILVFDEPTTGLDPRARRQLVDLLRAQSSTCVFATHDLALVAELCSRTIVLAGGVVVGDGPSREILFDDELMLAHGLECPRLDLPARLVPGRLPPTTTP